VTRAAQPLAKTLPRDFRIATLNAIFEAGDYRVSDIGSRLPGIGEALRRLEADVILLQECTRSALEFLGHRGWVREGYEVSRFLSIFCLLEEK
jgi:endonuclease/exonuclease/phosphatase family metal-dependent hydrolase